jgi:hypothetical protein
MYELPPQNSNVLSPVRNVSSGDTFSPSTAKPAASSMRLATAKPMLPVRCSTRSSGASIFSSSDLIVLQLELAEGGQRRRWIPDSWRSRGFHELLSSVRSRLPKFSILLSASAAAEPT